MAVKLPLLTGLRNKKHRRISGLRMGLCATHSEIDLLCKSVIYALRRVK